ncbi:MAG: hypoxanthine phosphoribosyltransferase [Acidimicrobiales bacterium]|jgi:hypoxanthine phosphoribosyltransferase
MSMATEHTVLFSADAIADKVSELAGLVDRDYGDDGLVVVVVMKGAAIFAADLVRAMSTEIELTYLTASSYVDGFAPGESLNLRGELDVAIKGRDVLIVDDIIDTGRTLNELSALVAADKPRSVATAALVNKTSRRSPGTEADYYGFEIGDEFIYGYGLDWDERYRDLPFIALANPS